MEKQDSAAQYQQSLSLRPRRQRIGLMIALVPVAGGALFLYFRVQAELAQRREMRQYLQGLEIQTVRTKQAEPAKPEPVTKSQTISTEKEFLIGNSHVGRIALRNIHCRIDANPEGWRPSDHPSARTATILTPKSFLTVQLALTYRSRALLKCVGGDAAFRVSFDAVLSQKKKAKAVVASPEGQMQNVKVHQSTDSALNACIVGAFEQAPGFTTPYAGQCEAILLFGDHKRAEQAAIAVMGPEAVTPAPLPSLTNMDDEVRKRLGVSEAEAADFSLASPDSPEYKYLAGLPPEQLLALLGLDQKEPRVSRFLAPLRKAIRRGDPDESGNVVLPGLGLRLRFVVGILKHIQIAHVPGHDIYPGRIPYELKLPMSGADVMAVIGDPLLVGNRWAMFFLPKNVITAVYNGQAMAELRASPILGLEFDLADKKE